MVKEIKQDDKKKKTSTKSSDVKSKTKSSTVKNKGVNKKKSVDNDKVINKKTTTSRKLKSNKLDEKKETILKNDNKKIKTETKKVINKKNDEKKNQVVNDNIKDLRKNKKLDKGFFTIHKDGSKYNKKIAYFDKKIKLDILDIFIMVVITAIVTCVGTSFLITRQYKKDNILVETELVSDDNISRFIKTYSEIVDNFYQDVDQKGMIDAALDGMLNYLEDNYSIYMDESESDSLSDSLAGTYDGIGIVSTGNVVYSIYDDSPAQKAGIQVGDEIIKVNGIEITMENYSLISTLILDNGDNENEVIVRRGEEEIVFKLKKGKVVVPTAASKIIEKNDKSIGFLVLDSFASKSYDDFKKELEKLEDSGIDSLIIDLRNNTGGYLEVAHNISSLFLEKGKLVYSLENKDDITEYKDKTVESRTYSIVVLVNGGTASASEILTAALKDSYGATIVGKTTYGKGKVQSLMNYDSSMVKYTSAKWLRPNGECIDGKGIVPDYDINNEVIDDTLYDRQLDKAIELLS